MTATCIQPRASGPGTCGRPAVVTVDGRSYCERHDPARVRGPASAEPEGPRLAETGQILVTLAAARSAALVWGCGEEEARKRLTLLLCDAHAVDARVQPERWRAKKRSTGWDITAQIAREGPLAVVVVANVRRRS